MDVRFLCNGVSITVKRETLNFYDTIGGPFAFKNDLSPYSELDDEGRIIINLPIPPRPNIDNFVGRIFLLLNDYADIMQDSKCDTDELCIDLVDLYINLENSRTSVDRRIFNNIVQKWGLRCDFLIPLSVLRRYHNQTVKALIFSRWRPIRSLNAALRYSPCAPLVCNYQNSVVNHLVLSIIRSYRNIPLSLSVLHMIPLIIQQQHHVQLTQQPQTLSSAPSPINMARRLFSDTSLNIPSSGITSHLGGNTSHSAAVCIGIDNNNTSTSILPSQQRILQSDALHSKEPNGMSLTHTPFYAKNSSINSNNVPHPIAPPTAVRSITASYPQTAPTVVSNSNNNNFEIDKNKDAIIQSAAFTSTLVSALVGTGGLGTLVFQGLKQLAELLAKSYFPQKDKEADLSADVSEVGSIKPSSSMMADYPASMSLLSRFPWSDHHAVDVGLLVSRILYEQSVQDEANINVGVRTETIGDSTTDYSSPRHAPSPTMSPSVRMLHQSNIQFDGFASLGQLARKSALKSASAPVAASKNYSSRDAVALSSNDGYPGSPSLSPNGGMVWADDIGVLLKGPTTTGRPSASFNQLYSAPSEANVGGDAPVSPLAAALSRSKGITGMMEEFTSAYNSDFLEKLNSSLHSKICNKKQQPNNKNLDEHQHSMHTSKGAEAHVNSNNDNNNNSEKWINALIDENLDFLRQGTWVRKMKVKPFSPLPSPPHHPDGFTPFLHANTINAPLFSVHDLPGQNTLKNVPHRFKREAFVNAVLSLRLGCRSVASAILLSVLPPCWKVGGLEMLSEWFDMPIADFVEICSVAGPILGINTLSPHLMNSQNYNDLNNNNNGNNNTDTFKENSYFIVDSKSKNFDLHDTLIKKLSVNTTTKGMQQKIHEDILFESIFKSFCESEDGNRVFEKRMNLFANNSTQTKLNNEMNSSIFNNPSNNYNNSQAIASGKTPLDIQESQLKTSNDFRSSLPPKSFSNTNNALKNRDGENDFVVDGVAEENYFLKQKKPILSSQSIHTSAPPFLLNDSTGDDETPEPAHQMDLFASAAKNVSVPRGFAMFERLNQTKEEANEDVKNLAMQMEGYQTNLNEWNQHFDKNEEDSSSSSVSQLRLNTSSPFIFPQSGLTDVLNKFGCDVSTLTNRYVTADATCASSCVSAIASPRASFVLNNNNSSNSNTNFPPNFEMSSEKRKLAKNDNNLHQIPFLGPCLPQFDLVAAKKFLKSSPLLPLVIAELTRIPHEVIEKAITETKSKQNLVSNLSNNSNAGATASSPTAPASNWVSLLSYLEISIPHLIANPSVDNIHPGRAFSTSANSTTKNLNAPQNQLQFTGTSYNAPVLSLSPSSQPLNSAHQEAPSNTQRNPIFSHMNTLSSQILEALLIHEELTFFSLVLSHVGSFLLSNPKAPSPLHLSCLVNCSKLAQVSISMPTPPALIGAHCKLSSLYLLRRQQVIDLHAPLSTPLVNTPAYFSNDDTEDGEPRDSTAPTGQSPAMDKKIKTFAEFPSACDLNLSSNGSIAKKDDHTNQKNIQACKKTPHSPSETKDGLRDKSSTLVNNSNFQWLHSLPRFTDSSPSFISEISDENKINKLQTSQQHRSSIEQELSPKILTKDAPHFPSLMASPSSSRHSNNSVRQQQQKQKQVFNNNKSVNSNIQITTNDSLRRFIPFYPSQLDNTAIGYPMSSIPSQSSITAISRMSIIQKNSSQSKISSQRAKHIKFVPPKPPLHLAAEKDRPNIIELLFNSGYDPNFLDYEGLSPLCEAAAADAVDAIRTLILNCHAEVNLTCGRGYTALHYGVVGGSHPAKKDSNRVLLSNVQTLLDLGGNPFVETDNYQIAIELAKQSGNSTALQILKEYKDVNTFCCMNRVIFNICGDKSQRKKAKLTTKKSGEIAKQLSEKLNTDNPPGMFIMGEAEVRTEAISSKILEVVCDAHLKELKT